jgi:hypothetical protein
MIATLLGAAALILALTHAPAQAQTVIYLQGPYCFEPQSFNSKLDNYRLYLTTAPNGSYLVGGRAVVRTLTGLGQMNLSYPAAGGGYTSGGNINLALENFWINSGTTNAEPFHARMVFPSSLAMGATGTYVEDVGGVTTSYTVIRAACEDIGF